MCLSTRPTSKWLFVLRLPSGSLETTKNGTLVTLGPHNFVCRPTIEMRSKTKLYPHRELFNGMSHATCTQGNWVISRLLVVGSQSANLTFGPSFSHNLCFKCPNGWCEPILDIYVLIAFQWYKKLFKPLGFDPYNRSLNIWESTGTPTPKVEAPLGVWRFIPSHFPSLPGFPLGSQPCKPLP